MMCTPQQWFVCETFDESLSIILPGWRFSHLMALEPSGYQCNLVSDDATVTGTGSTPAEAVAYANQRAAFGPYLPLYIPGDHTLAEAPKLNISELMRRRYAPEPIERRI